jgi:hypothetical protein
VREDGRQILIDRGVDPATGDRGENESTGGGEEEEGEANPDGRADDGGPSPAKRGKIADFSPGARRRLREIVHAIDRDADILFLTLTWHEEMPSPEEAKRALDRFSKRFGRAFPGGSFIWKLEPQERGVPHFHLFVYNVSWVDPQAISRLWHDCTSEASSQHRKSGVDVEWVRDDGKMLAYLAKYMSKVGSFDFGDDQQTWEWPGRFWGVRHRDNLPVVPWSDWQVQIYPSEAARLISELLDEWGVDGIPDGVIPPTLMVNTRGDPLERLDTLLDRLD